jgi:hypothetical protein
MKIYVEEIFDKFPKYTMKILLGHFNAKVGKKDIFANQQLECFSENTKSIQTRRVD